MNRQRVLPLIVAGGLLACGALGLLVVGWFWAPLGLLAWVLALASIAVLVVTPLAVLIWWQLGAARVPRPPPKPVEERSMRWRSG
jgi:uncharacterized protein (DUF58 family)